MSAKTAKYFSDKTRSGVKLRRKRMGDTTTIRLAGKDAPQRAADFADLLKRRSAKANTLVVQLVDLLLAFEKKHGRPPVFADAEIVERKKTEARK